METDTYYTNFIANTAFLKDISKNTYLKKLNTIKNIIFTNENNSPNSIKYILHHPNDFATKLQTYATNTKGPLGKPLGDHTKDAYFAAVIALFTYNEKLKEGNPDLYKQWKTLQENIQKPIKAKYTSHIPTDRQKEAYMPFDEVIKIRDSLPRGSPARLLIMMYTEIPPVRSDFFQTPIYTKMPNISNVDENFIVLDKNKAVLILQKYKTDEKYKTKTIEIPQKLREEIEYSIIKNPREFLFVSTQNGLPYQKDSTFNQWANETLKRVFNKPNFSLSMLRHIYISRRDLNLELDTTKEQQQLSEKIANDMGHSVAQQKKYMWHSWIESNK